MIATVIICIILAVVVFFAIRSVFKRKSGCCCGSGCSTCAGCAAVKQNPAGTSKYKYSLSVDGMHCENCVKSVREALFKIGVVYSDVSLKNKNAIIYSDRKLEKDTVFEAIDKAGFRLISMEEL